jgi:hypothetical protein
VRPYVGSTTMGRTKRCRRGENEAIARGLDFARKPSIPLLWLKTNPPPTQPPCACEIPFVPTDVWSWSGRKRLFLPSSRNFTEASCEGARLASTRRIRHQGACGRSFRIFSVVTKFRRCERGGDRPQPSRRPDRRSCNCDSSQVPFPLSLDCRLICRLRRDERIAGRH